jgi:hypothetical protein
MTVAAVAASGTPGEAGSGLGEEPVEVAVVGPGELQELRAAGRGAREADDRHRRLGPARGHAQHLDRGDAARDLLGELDLAGRRGAVGRPAARRVGHRREDLGVRVPVDQRAPGHDVVDELVAVDVDERAARRPLHEQRVAADRPHRADGRVDAAREALDRAGVELRALGVLERDAH